ncbi:MAG: hypothetical protein Q4C70_04985 [Planctomycetia bacterium]|nr:hypothetical protein [Planctomycetia bacterium]
MKSEVCVFSFFLYLLFALPAFFTSSVYGALYEPEVTFDDETGVLTVVSTLSITVKVGTSLSNMNVVSPQVSGGSTYNLTTNYRAKRVYVKVTYSDGTDSDNYTAIYIVPDVTTPDITVETTPGEGDVDYQTQVITLLEELPVIKDCVLYTFVSCALLWGSVLYISFMQRR